MSWNNGFEKRKFEREWAKNEALYRKEGMTDEQIAEIRKFDEEIYNSNRRFTEHTQDFPTSDFDEGTADEAESTLLRNFADEMSVTMDGLSFHQDRYWWIEEIDDDRIVSLIKTLSERDIEMLTKLVVEQKTHQEIASAMNVSVRTIERKYAAFKKIFAFLKKD